MSIFQAQSPQIREHWGDNRNECDTVHDLEDLKSKQGDKYMFFWGGGKLNTF